MTNPVFTSFTYSFTSSIKLFAVTRSARIIWYSDVKQYPNIEYELLLGDYEEIENWIHVTAIFS